jgi:DNA polymerase-3 subunit epsilon
MKKKKALPALEVLVLDVQASGTHPGNGHPLEIGWARIRASLQWKTIESRIESYLCQLPEGEDIPRQVTRVTGLKTGDLHAGLPLAAVWEKLMTIVRQITPAGKGDLCPTIIHYSRYEEPFLHSLHQEYPPRETFPFDILCTHQLTRRLLPGLPRKSLRATAGYLGHSVPELRRSCHHIAATAFIWRRLVQLLEEKGVRTLAELKEWLKKPMPKISAPGRDYLLEAAQRLNLPKKPGVYRMFRPNGDLLYIGKATSLKNRVNSYFHQRKRGSYAKNTLEMLTQAAHLEVRVTGSALEAALLETDEIKRHAPPYNTALRQRDRQIAFYSRDLRESAPHPGESHPIGPLPTGKTIPAFAAVAVLLKGELTEMAEEEVCLLTLGLPREYAPELQCFWEGVEMFRQRHKPMLETYAGKSFITGLMKLGKQLRLEQLAELAAAAAAAKKEKENEEDNPTEIDNPEANEIETEQRTWTPVAVADVMEGIIRWGAHLIRRARWFCLLSESALAWHTGKTAGKNRRLLVLQGGAVTQQEDIAVAERVPTPPHYDRPFAARQRNFDVMTYDRMRVLTTELRRLVSAETDRDVQLRLNPRILLKHQQLLNLLKWV